MGTGGREYQGLDAKDEAQGQQRQEQKSGGEQSKGEGRRHDRHSTEQQENSQEHVLPVLAYGHNDDGAVVYFACSSAGLGY